MGKALAASYTEYCAGTIYLDFRLLECVYLTYLGTMTMNVNYLTDRLIELN